METEQSYQPDSHQELSRKFLDYRKVVWSKNSDTTLSEKKEALANQVKGALEATRKLPEDSEERCLYSKLLLNTGRETLNKDEAEELVRTLSSNKEKYPIITDVDKAIATIKGQALGFFVSSGEGFMAKEKTLSIPKTRNDIANTIILTEIQRIAIDQSSRKSEASGGENFSTQTEEKQDSFEILFKK